LSLWHPAGFTAGFGKANAGVPKDNVIIPINPVPTMREMRFVKATSL